MSNYFTISGYFVDDHSEFTNYTVKDTHDVLSEQDEDIFYYGISEEEIKQAIIDGENTTSDFVITSYTPI